LAMFWLWYMNLPSSTWSSGCCLFDSRICHFLGWI